MLNYYQKKSVPIKVIQARNNSRKRKKNSLLKYIAKYIFCLSLALVLISTQGHVLSAFETYIINVTARICRWSETRSMGYWKNHSSIYEAYLPQTLGNEVIETVEDASEVFNNAHGESMKNKLKAQLLAMKFNIAHFDIGGYIIEGYSIEKYNGKTIYEIVAQADLLLQQDPVPPKEVLEEIKDLLDYLNNLHQLRYCNPNSSKVTVVIPNGGETWWVGRTHNIEWTTTNLTCSGDTIIDIWYSGDSGQTFANIIKGTENDGVYEWRVPPFLGDYFVPSSRARVKVVAKCADDLSVQGWDMSDADFCPPIDYALLTPEDFKLLLDHGYITINEIEQFIRLGVIQDYPPTEPTNEPTSEEDSGELFTIPSEGPIGPVSDIESIGTTTQENDGIAPIETTTPVEEGVVPIETTTPPEEETTPTEPAILEEKENSDEEIFTPTQEEPLITSNNTDTIDTVTSQEEGITPQENNEI